MRIAVLGGGPGGLYFGALAKQLDPRHEITVTERNAADDTFGFGVVFSDETLGGIEHADQEIFSAMRREFARWDDIDVHFRGTTFTSGGHGFAAMSRKRLLAILQARCAELGVRVLFGSEVTDVAGLAATHDLVVAADGMNSATRARFAPSYGPELDRRRCRYIWLGTSRVFDAFKFYVLDTPAGIMQVHGYPYSDQASTFILEMHEDVWHRAGFADAAAPLAPGQSDEGSLDLIRGLCADVLSGHRLIASNSRWTTFTTVRCRAWRHENVVLLGDAAHTAHFSIGSGTKLAMDDALALAACLHEQVLAGPGTVSAALAAYERERRPVVASTQRAAQASLEWFENIGQYAGQDPHQFAFNIVTRSRRVGYDNLRLRDPGFVAAVDRWFARSQGVPGRVRPPMFQPFRLGGLELANRVIVSPMDMYSARDGVPDDFHLVHLGGQALGGAGLVMTEMVCVSPAGRITPGCTGIYTAGQEESWRRITAFVHGHTGAKMGIQLGHSGRKGSTRLMWDGMGTPLADGNWEVCGPSPIPYAAGSQTPRELTLAELDEIRGQFTAAARAAGRSGFDLLELHCAHGYLLSSFLSPLANRRTDRYGGSPAARLRYPLEVFDSVRAAWPRDRPMTVRISATDWCEGGLGSDDAVEVARAFAEHGAAGIDVSTGQVVSEERPAFGRSYQTPYADRIRNEIGCRYGVAVIAVGAISSYDDVNSLILAGRADLCALGRTHLYDPRWTLHAAAEQGYAGPGASWPDQFAAGSRRPQAGRTEDPRPRLDLIRAGAPGPAHARWRPGTVAAATETQALPAKRRSPAGHAPPPRVGFVGGTRRLTARSSGMIEARDLTKFYGGKAAVDHLSFTVEPGRVTGFLGPNGAGKSTTMRLILGLDRPASGTALIDGKRYRDLRDPLRTVGALLEAKSVHPGRSARNHLLFLAQTQGLPARRVEEVLGLVGLQAVAGKRAGGFSLGMSQRLGVAAAMLGDPEILLLDEPVNGLDPEGVLWIRNLMKQLAGEGRTVLVSSHLMNEMAVTADHLIVIGRGKLITESSTEDVIARSTDQSVRVRTPDADRLAALITEAGGKAAPGPPGPGAGLLTVTGLPASRIGELAASGGVVLHELTPLASLEEAFMELTSGSLEFGTHGADPVNAGEGKSR